MLLDGHIHIMDCGGSPRAFHARLREAGVDGGVVISLPPATFADIAAPRPAAERLEDLFRWTADHDRLYPVFWIDPLEEDAERQVDAAAERGVAGFKVICNRYFPGEERPMKIFRAIAAAGKPILFHSGILWDGRASSRYNRPAEFEALLEVDRLRFSLAHISWPWCDEAIAVYGKFLDAHRRRPALSVEMFIDTTPGTPGPYRREVLTRLFSVGYDVAENVFFGSDNRANDYRVAWVREWVERDRTTLRDLGLDDEGLEKVFGGNLERFVTGICGSAQGGG